MGARRQTKKTGRSHAVALAIALALALIVTPGSQAAPFEPNDSVLNATGPLTFGETMSGALETPSDRDFYFFYVTSPGPAEVALTVNNLGGGTPVSDIDVAIVDGLGTPLRAVAFIRKGEGRVATVTLAPQKYFIEVTANEGSGDAYSLLAGGGEGAFGGYDPIAGRCAKATVAVSTAAARVQRAKTKLQRAIGLVRRNRYGNPDARLIARRNYRRAKSGLATAKDQLEQSEGSLAPWCAIPR